ncbi:hypothetical protein [Chryseobacterium jejuense]|nr:hypothetical protein [Chryseobacterium jejuense]
MKQLFIVFLFVLSCFVVGQINSSKDFSSSLAPVHQLRIYEIPKENRKVVLDRFRDHALRMMKKYGFIIVSIWEPRHEGKTEFVYLLEWKNEEAVKIAW